MESTLNKPLVGNLVYSLLGKRGSGGWRDMPADWSDIRKDCPKNSIALYAAHKADYSSYDNLGFTATCTGGYNVYIDGVQYSTTYASGAQCSITWSTSGITTGDDITTPSALKAHKIWIEPATSGNDISAFSMGDRQGLLWIHSNVSTEFDSLYRFAGVADTSSSLIKAVTAKNNVLKSKNMNQAFGRCPNLEYLPVLDFCDSTSAQSYIFYNYGTYKLKTVVIKNLKHAGNVSNFDVFHNAWGLEQITLKNTSFCWYQNTLNNVYSLKSVPKGLYQHTGSLSFTQASGLEPTYLDCRERTSASFIRTNGSSDHTMYGLKGLRVSNEAPFDNATAPQINVSYTGLDRSALVQLFEDLPTVNAGQIISIVGTTGASDLSADDELIATAKGWTITK